jgi:hypothetical protein
MKSLNGLEKGKVIRFDYPAHNYAGARRKMERRHLRVRDVRRLADQPLDEVTVKMNPALNRGEILVDGEDLDKDDRRMFYFERMENVEVVEHLDGAFDLVLCDSAGDSSPEVVGRAPSVNAAIAGVREWLGEPLGLIVGVRKVG